MWTLSQRRALIALTAAAAAGLAIEHRANPVGVGLLLPPHGLRSAELTGRLDPNTASAAMLSVLPELGRSRAQVLVVYRTDFTAAHPGQIAFHSAEDLKKVKGIGPAMAQKLAPYLSFEDAATKP